MTEKEVVDFISNNIEPSVPRSKVKDIIRGYHQLMFLELCAGRSWKLPKVGTINIYSKPVRWAGGKVVKAKKLPKFNPSSVLKGELKDGR